MAESTEPSDLNSEKPLTDVQKLVVRAALSEEEFSYYDLAELTGRSRENLRKIKNELSKRFPQVFVMVGQEEAEVGRKSSLWKVNPDYVEALSRLSAEEVGETHTRARQLRQYPILEHARKLLLELHSDPDHEVEIIERVQELLDRTQKAFETVGNAAETISPELRTTFEIVGQDAEKIDQRLRGRDEKTGWRILAFLGEAEEPEPKASDQPTLVDLVKYVRIAPPGAGRGSLFEFDGALIGSADDPGADDQRRLIAETMSEHGFLENLAESFSGTLRRACRTEPFARVAEKLIGSFRSLGLPPNATLANKIDAAAQFEGLDPDLREDAQSLADTLRPRGDLAGHAEGRPFNLPEDARASLAGCLA